MNQIILWLLSHFGLIAWPAVVAGAWKLSSILKGYRDRAEKVESTVELIATNHLPHIQSELEKVNTSLDGGFQRIADGLTHLLLAMKKD